MEWNTPEKITIRIRLASALLDLVIASVVAIPPVFFVFLEFVEVWLDGPGPPRAATSSFALYLLPLPLALYLCKDCLRGRSIAKRILRLHVVNLASGQAASPLQCALRNLSVILWPLEVVVLLFNPSRRIGDWIAGTEVCFFEAQDAAPAKLRWERVLLSFLFVYACCIFLFWCWLHALEAPSAGWEAVPDTESGVWH